LIIQQTNSFKRRVKKMHQTEKIALDKAIKTIANNPSVDSLKTGDLSGIQVFKYKYNTIQYTALLTRL